MADKKMNTRIVIVLVPVIIILGYISYMYLFGINVTIKITNNSQYIVQTDSTGNALIFNNYEIIDLKIVVNDKPVFNDSLSNKKIHGTQIKLNLKPGWNTVEVYSKKAKMFSVNSSFLFFKRKYYITFTNSITGEFYSLSVYDGFF